ncbi:hypothetical protein Pmani_015159 [Petrolisthes manimaculis]|uniref:Uncharacterized protein n=1 Tax=Petrolisthes manimaculis TaxID=1843537 RepID=A0AAE1PUH0_9EUCA|nr:hypothetical protein Pmani_015159 [Petrolisthes manimaculis]
MRNNKVGVEQCGGGSGGGGGGGLVPGMGGVGGGGGVTDVVTDDEDRSGSGSGTNLSAKMRASSGLSQFQEVDFSNQVCFYNGDSLKKTHTGKPPTLSNFEEERGSISEWKPKKENWRRLKDDLMKKINSKRGSRDYGEEMADFNVKVEVPECVATENDILDEILSKTELAAMSVNGRKKLRERLERSADGRLEGIEDNSTARQGEKLPGCDAVPETSTTNTAQDSTTQGSNPKQYDSQRKYNNVGCSSGYKSRQPVSNGEEYMSGSKRNNSSSRDGDPVPSTSTTVDTELSLHSTGEGDDEEDSVDPPRRIPPPDEQEKPNLTPVSLAIYSNLSQEGPSRSRNMFLMATATCTFIITVVLAVAILVAPKTLAKKDEQPHRHTAITAAYNRSKHNHSEGLPLPAGGRSELLVREPNVTVSLLMALRKPTATTITTWTSNNNNSAGNNRTSEVKRVDGKTSTSVDVKDTQFTSTSVDVKDTQFTSTSVDVKDTQFTSTSVDVKDTQFTSTSVDDKDTQFTSTSATPISDSNNNSTSVNDKDNQITSTSDVPVSESVNVSVAELKMRHSIMLTLIPAFTPVESSIPAIPTPTDTPIPATPTDTPIAETPTPTETFMLATPTPTHTLIPATLTPTKTFIPTMTTPTNTLILPTPTPTFIPATPTPTDIFIPATPTPTLTISPPTLTPTDTLIPATPTPTKTLIPPTHTYTLIPPTPTPTDIFIPATPTPASAKNFIQPLSTNTPSTPAPHPYPN